MKITAPNTTHIPNVIFDYWMSRLSPGEFKILMCICRKTFGWQKERDSISRAQIVAMTGLSRDGVRKSLSVLEDYGLIVKTEQFNDLGDNDPNLYEINVEDDKKPGVGDSVAGGVATESPTGRLLSSPTKERHTKENIQNIYTPADAAAPAAPPPSLATKKIECANPANHPGHEAFTAKYGPLVGLTLDQHNALVARHGRETVIRAYEYLALWKISKAETDAKAITKHTDYYRLTKWVIKEVIESGSAAPGQFKRTGKLAISADVRAMEEMKANPRKIETEAEVEEWAAKRSAELKAKSQKVTP